MSKFKKSNRLQDLGIAKVFKYKDLSHTHLMQVVNDSRVYDVQADPVPVNPQWHSMKSKPREQIQSDTVTQKSSIFQEGTHLPRVHSQLVRALRARSAAPEPEEIPCLKPVISSPG